MGSRVTISGDPAPDNMPPEVQKAYEMAEALARHCTEHGIICVGAVGVPDVHVISFSAGCCPMHVYATAEAIVHGLEKNWGPIDQFDQAPPTQWPAHDARVN